jgi:membrane associated rhomboid family serine protease
MRDASVGFHCPDCVKEGARSTRQGRAVYGGKRVRDAARTSMVLIGLNALVWLGVLATGDSGGGSLVDKLALLPQTTTFRFQDGSVQLIEGVSGGAYWQLVTSMFLHEQVLHIGFNMLALWFLGPQLEMVLGRARFLALYLVSGLTGAAAVMWFSGAHTQTLGASGAIFGLMGALVVVAMKVGADFRQILMWIGLNLVFTFYAGANISWQGHVGGLLGGAVLAGVIVYAPKQNREALQWAGVTLVALVTLAAIVARAVQLG